MLSSFAQLFLIAIHCTNELPEWRVFFEQSDHPPLSERIDSFAKNQIYKDYRSQLDSPEANRKPVEAVLKSSKHKAYLESIIALKEKHANLLDYRLPGPDIQINPHISYPDFKKVIEAAGYKVIGEINDPKKIESMDFPSFKTKPTSGAIAMNQAGDGMIILINQDKVFGISVYEDAPTEIERNHFNNVRALKVLQILDASEFKASIESQKHSLGEEEKRTIQRIRNPKSPLMAERITASDLGKFFDAPDSILLINDDHSKAAPLQALEKLAEFPEVAWIGIEFSQRYGKLFQDPARDQELKLLEEPIKERDSRQEIMHRRFTKAGEFFSTWDSLRRIQKDAAKPINFLDTDEYVLTAKDALGILSLATGVRNDFMAKQIPPNGRGVVLMGRVHIDYPLNINLQDFIADRFPGRKVFVLE